jgi:branched-subunit amino acid transport protein
VTPTWTVIGAVALGTIALKGAGPLLLGGRPLPAKVDAMVRLAGPALLAALVAISTFAREQELIVDARLGGVAVAGIGIWLRAPALMVVILAAAVTAGLRAFGG